MTGTRHLTFRQSLLALLSSEPADETGLLAAIKARARRGEPVYSTLIEILTHLSFEEAEARAHWRSVLAHRQLLRRRLGRDPGLRVALLDYFANVNRELQNPKVIEIAIYERTQHSAHSDGLTGLYNHSFLVQAARREVLRARRHGRRLSLVMLDLDDFKRVNDTYGHLEGDRALVAAAQLVRDNLREIDTAARYGGEEFAVLLPETSRTGAFVVAERIRAAVERHFRRRPAALRVTVSGGVATFPDDARDVEELLRRADEALYRAKAAGKNRIVMLRGERRRHARVVADSAATLEAGAELRGRLRNVSAGGLLLALSRPVPVGSDVRLAVHAGRGHPLEMRATVVRVARANGRGGPYEAGLRLAGAQAGPALLGRLDAALALASPMARAKGRRASAGAPARRATARR